MAERVGDRIRQRRKALGLTGTELAQRVGAAGKEVVSVWENRSTPPDQPYLTRLARLFGVTEAWLLHGDAALDSTAQQVRVEAWHEGYRAGLELAVKTLQDLAHTTDRPTLAIVADSTQNGTGPGDEVRGRSGEAMEVEAAREDEAERPKRKDHPAG